jgi:hypothetical protein
MGKRLARSLAKAADIDGRGLVAQPFQVRLRILGGSLGFAVRVFVEPPVQGLDDSGADVVRCRERCPGAVRIEPAPELSKLGTVSLDFTDEVRREAPIN